MIRARPALISLKVAAITTALTLAVLALAVVLFRGDLSSLPDSPQVESGGKRLDQQAPPLGLSIHEPSAFPGYTLLAPVKSAHTYLIDMQGRVVRTWTSNCSPALGACLLDNGHLLRTGAVRKVALDDGPGAGGRVQEFTWDGSLVWDFQLHDDKHLPHHDITRLPNGNVLMIVWDGMPRAEAIAAGRRPDLLDEYELLPDCLIEVERTGPTTGEVVWEWYLRDHLVQDHDPSKSNYGNVAEHPELVDFNYVEDPLAPITSKQDGLNKLRSLGYLGSRTPAKTPSAGPFVWSHLNAVAYHACFDQIMVTSLTFSEFWVIDHSTTTAEAASHRGGRSGKGGDLLYRWGNPRAYRAGKKVDQRLFTAHHSHWIPRGLPGQGNVLVFNNGSARPDGNYSSVEELVLPVDAEGRYARRPGTAYGPDQALWSYSAPRKTDFYSMLLSGAQRLPNANTLICSGSNGTLVEVTPDNEIVWKYINPTKGGYGPGGPGPGNEFGPPGGESLFRAYRYSTDHPGLVGKDLTPRFTLEEARTYDIDGKAGPMGHQK